MLVLFEQNNELVAGFFVFISGGGNVIAVSKILNNRI